MLHAKIAWYTNSSKISMPLLSAFSMAMEDLSWPNLQRNESTLLSMLISSNISAIMSWKSDNCWKILWYGATDKFKVVSLRYTNNMSNWAIKSWKELVPVESQLSFTTIKFMLETLEIPWECLSWLKALSFALRKPTNACLSTAELSVID